MNGLKTSIIAVILCLIPTAVWAQGATTLVTPVVSGLPVSGTNPLPVTGGGGGLSVIDQAVWTQGTSSFTPAGGVFNDASTLTSGQQGTFRLTTKRAQIVDVDSTGSQLHTDLTASVPAGTNFIGGIRVCDTSTNTNCATVNPASTAALATNLSVAMQLTPNSPGIIALGANTAANSVPVNIGPVVLGSYCMANKSGTMAAGLAASSPIFSYRYGGANLAIVRKVKFSAGDAGTAFAAGNFVFDLFAARGFTASDTGGAASTITGNNGKLRTSYATTAISDFRTATTATLTAGTRTLDASQLGSITSSDAATAGNPILTPSDYLLGQNVGEQPLQLATNEGFVVQATVPATGTWVFSVQVCWDEVTAF